jgi:hypothetical protein
VGLRKPWRKVERQFEFSPSSSKHISEKGHGKLLWTGYKDHTTCAGVHHSRNTRIMARKQRKHIGEYSFVGNQTLEPTAYRRAMDLPL